MMKSLWIVNHHAHIPSKDGAGARHHGLAVELARLGWDCTIFASSTLHPSGAQGMNGPNLYRTTVEDGVTYRWIRSNRYGTNLGLRFIGMFAFAANLLAPWGSRRINRPDVVIGSTVHPLAAWAGYVLARRYSVPFIYEIRDIWPESLSDMGKLSTRSPLYTGARALSKFLATRAQLVISPLADVDTYVQELTGREAPFEWISNGVPAAYLGKNPERMDYEPPGPFTFMYLGSHGNANAIDLIIEAFCRVCAEVTDEELPLLRIVGDGPLKQELIGLAASTPYSGRITFEDRIPRDEVMDRAREAHCLIAASRDHNVYRFGSSPNKLFDYLLAARPVVRATNVSKNPISESGGGIVVPAGDAAAMARAMHEMVLMRPKERQEMGLKGREYVLEHFTYSALAERLDKALRVTAAHQPSKGR